MNAADWKPELNRLLTVFEVESTISLRKIKRCFGELNRSFDDDFHSYVAKMLSLSLDTSFNIVQFERLDDDGQMQNRPNPNDEGIGSNASILSNNDSLNATQNEEGMELKIGNNVGSDDGDDVFRGFEIQATNDPIEGQEESNATQKSIHSNDEALSNENYVVVDVKREIKVENVEDELIDLPMIEFDPTEYNGRLSAANDATVADDLSSNPRQPSVPSKTKGRLTHKNIFRCEDCDYTTQYRSTSDRHQLIHRGIKPFKCDHCDYACRRKSDLKKHQRIHDGQKLMGIARDCKDETYKCPQCDRQFTELNHLSNHVTILHKNNRRLFNCLRCMRPFAQKTEKDRHEIRCKIRRYECYVCKKYFTRDVTQMQEHMRTHSGAKPFKCAICNKYFRAKTNLGRHLRDIHSRA